jgi:Tfp pilus assembly protein PilX
MSTCDGRTGEGRRRSERGSALGLVVATALLSSMGAYVMLQLANSQAQQAQFHRNRMRARYAAEAGFVWAKQRLEASPPAPEPTFDDAPDLEVDGIPVDITVICEGGGAPPCGTDRRTIRVSVSY